MTTLLLVGLFSFLLLQGLERRAHAEEIFWVDPASLALGELPAWADPRWGEEFEARMLELAPFPADDEQSLWACAEEIRSLSFIRELTYFALGEDGALELAFSLRRPVAALPCDSVFRLVSQDGTILSGVWSVPPRIAGVWLPVLGPLEDAELFAAALPGDWLEEHAHLAALDVAASLDEHLDLTARALLGRVLIDATREAEASLEEPGVRLYLEDRRLAFFGRAPRTAGAGELPARDKWRSLSRALRRLEPSDAGAAIDWSLVDLRWDRPDLVPRELPPPPEEIPFTFLGAPEEQPTRAAEPARPSGPKRPRVH